MKFKELRERLNIFLYGNKDAVLRVLQMLSIVVTVFALGIMVYFYGFPHSNQEKEVLLNLIKFSFGFYILRFLFRWIYDFNPNSFLKKHWFEAALMLLLTLEGLNNFFFGKPITQGLFADEAVRDFSNVIVQLYFFIVLLTSFGDSRSILPKIKLNPATIFILSFVILISSGALLLMMPEMTNGGISFVDAVFTSTSACSVTGLMVQDSVTFFTFKGKVVLLILFQLGGLNIIAFGWFLALISKFGVSVRQDDLIEDFVSSDTMSSAKGMLQKVLLWSFGIQILVALALFFLWGDSIELLYAEQGLGDPTLGDQLFYSVFHAVSSFNNAGISLFPDSFNGAMVAGNYLLHWVIIISIFLGSVGLVAIFDMFDPKNLRDRMRNPWKTIGFATKIALYFHLILVVLGAIPLFFLEKGNTMVNHSLFGRITESVFMSLTTRSAGFNSLPTQEIGQASLFILVILMFLGASSSSSGGGIKTSTTAIIYANVMSTIRGKNFTELFKRTISSVLVQRAYSVLLFFIVVNLLGTILLCITEHEMLASGKVNILHLIFEQVSGMSTVGLSMGITSDLSTAGKIIITTSMFIGRVGTLTVAFALTGNTKTGKYRYAEGHTMVG